MRILVIDDQPHIVNSLARLLGQRAQVIEATTPHEARANLERFGNDLDLVITDFDLGEDENGDSTTAANLPLGLARCPFILTAGSKEVIPDALRKRAVAVVRKPFSWSAIEPLVAAALREAAS